MTEQTDNGFPEAWVPEAGAVLKGTVVEVSTGDGGYGPYPIVTISTEDGERAVHAFHTVLRNELAKRAPKAGDELTITYRGLVQNKSGKGANDGRYHAYRVSGGSEVGYDWSQDLPADEPVGSDIPSDLDPPKPEPVTVPADVKPDEDPDSDLPF